ELDARTERFLRHDGMQRPRVSDRPGRESRTKALHRPGAREPNLSPGRRPSDRSEASLARARGALGGTAGGARRAPADTGARRIRGHRIGPALCYRFPESEGIFHDFAHPNRSRTEAPTPSYPGA